jgi:hypothetical protein
MSTGYGQSVIAINPTRRLPKNNRFNKRTTMKLTFKQRLRNWLMNDDDDDYGATITIDDVSPNLSSQGFRLNIYGASGGTIVETTKYDRKHDENRNSLHIITDDKDLGEELGKIITMEQLR